MTPSGTPIVLFANDTNRYAVVDVETKRAAVAKAGPLG